MMLNIKKHTLSLHWLKLAILTSLLCSCTLVHTPHLSLFHKAKTKDGAPKRTVNVDKIPDATPKAEAKSHYGNPASYNVKGHRYFVKKSSQHYKERGIASWYGTKFHHHLTSNREEYDMFAMTAAHRTLPLPTYASVTNLKNGKHIIVKINDRGPFNPNRIIDLSYVAAKKLGILQHGTGLVEVEAINPSKKPSTFTHSHYPPGKSTEDIASDDSLKPEIYLQVAAYAHKENAKHLSEKLTDILHQPVKLVIGRYKHHPIYRVQIGPLASVAQSDIVHKKLGEAGFGNALAVIQ